MRTNPDCRLPLFLALLAGLSACSAPRFEVTPRVQQAKFEGSFTAEAAAVTLTSNDVVGDLGLGETSDEFGGRADLILGGSTFTFAYSPASFSGDGTLSADITQGGVTINAGTAVTTDLQMDIGSLIWTYDFVPGEAFELGLGLGAHWIDFHSTITDGLETAVFDQAVPVPVIAGRAGAVFGPFDVSALVSGMQAKQGSDEATFVDADLMGRWRFYGGVGEHLSLALVLGWHKTDVKLDYTDATDHVNADFNVSGLYYGLTVGF